MSASAFGVRKLSSPQPWTTTVADSIRATLSPSPVASLLPPRLASLHTLAPGVEAMANDDYDYSIPQPPALSKGSPAGVATTPSLGSYPTSLRTPATAAAATYSSRVPLVAHLHAVTATASAPRSSLTTRVHAQAGRVPSRSTSSTATTTRRKPRTSNPFEELSAPAFDAFIDNITSTLRSVLEPPPAPSKLSDERKRRERERQERERERQVARLEREQRRRKKRGEEDVFGEVVAVVDAAAVVDEDSVVGQIDDNEAQDGRLEIQGKLARRANPTASSVNKSVSPVGSEVIVLDSSSSDHEDEDEDDVRGPGEQEKEEDQLGDYEEEEDDGVRGQAREVYSRSSRDVDSADQERDGRAFDGTDDESFARAEEEGGEEEEKEQREGEATFALLEMRQVDRGPGRTPLFLQRGTASVSTSEADAEELFQRFDEDEDDDTRGHGQGEQSDEDMDEIEGGDHHQQPEEAAFARSLYSTTEESAAVVVGVDQSYTLLEAAARQGGEDIYDVDALGEGIQEEEKEEEEEETRRRAAAQGDERALPLGSMSPVVVVANTGSRDASPFYDMIEMDRDPEAEQQDDNDDDPSMFTDPFGRPVRYAYGFAEEQAGGASEEYEDYVEYEEREGEEEEEAGHDDERDPFRQQQQRRREEEEEEEERDLLRRGDGVGSVDEEEGEEGDGGNAMDPAEAEWAGRPTPARPQPRSGSGSPAASESAPASAAATAKDEEAEEAVEGEEEEDGSASPPCAKQTPAVEVLELDSSDSEADVGRGREAEVDGGAGARGEDVEEEDLETEEAASGAEEEEEQRANLTAQMLGGSEPELAVDSASAAEQQQGEDQLAGGDVEANEVEGEEPMDLSNAPPTPAAVSFEPEPSAETPPPVAATTGAESTFVAAADQSMEWGSTATTPALQTPAAVPEASDSYFGPPGEVEDREAVESGALADVDEDDVVMREQPPEPASVPLSQAADAAVDLADEAEITAAPTPPPQIALPLQESAAVPASSTADAGVKAFEIDEANLADVEEEADVGAEAAIEIEAVQVQKQPASEADSLVVTAAEGPSPADDVGLQSDGEATSAQAGESADAAGSATNPLEALYEHEDSEVSTSRIPYEAKGKGRAPMTPSDLDFDGDADAADAEDFGDVELSSSDSTESDNGIVDRIAFAISQWHSVSDQLRFYDRDELVEKLIELRAQYEHANKTESPWEMLIRIQLYDVETEYERRKAAGIDDSGSEDDLLEADARREEGSDIRSQASGGEDAGSSDAERHALFLDEEYEPEAEGSDAERMRDDSGSPRPVDRSAFPDSPSPSGQDDALSAEQVAAEARLAAIADELIDLHGSDPNSELRVSSSALEAVDSPAEPHSPPHPYSLYALDQPALSLAAETLESSHYPPPTSTSQAVEASGITTLTFGPDSEPSLEPHRPFLRSAEKPSQVQHAGNIEYELAPPPRTSSPPRFPPVPTEHRVDSPVTEDGDEPGPEREASEGLVRVGVDEEEMADSTFVGRNLPLRGAIDASREDLHEQADLESTPAASQALVVIDDDEEAEEPSEPSPKSAAPPIGTSPEGSPRKRIGATPPSAYEAAQDAAPIVDGVAPPVNYDILPDAAVRDKRTPEPPVPASTASRDDAKQPEEAGQIRSLKSTEKTATLLSAQLNRESAAQEATTDSRVPFQLPPTVHRPDSPINEDELSEDSDVVRVGVTAEEESDPRLVEEAKPLASAVDVYHTSLHEQDDFSTCGDASSAALAVVDDDADANITTAFDEAVEASAAVLDQATQTSPNASSDPPAGLVSRIEEATAFPYGVAPPLNPDIVPAPISAQTTETDDTFNVADFVALGSDDEEDESDAPSSAALPISGSLQAEQLPKADLDAPQARSVLGLPAGDAVVTMDASPAMAVDSEDEDREAERESGDKSEHALDGEQNTERAKEPGPSSPLHVSGVQEPGEWDPTSPIRFGRVERVERDSPADAEAEPALAVEEQQTAVVQVVIEVDTDGEGVQPTNVESVRGSSVATEGLLNEHGNRDPFADVDVVSAHSPGPEAQSAPPRHEEEDRQKPEKHAADPERNNGLDVSQAPSSTDDAKAVDAIDFAEEVSPQAPESQPQEDASERPDVPVAGDIVYTDSDSDDDEEVLALLSPRKPAPVASAGPSKAPKATRRSRVEAVAQEESAESSSPAVRRSSRLSTTPAATPVPPTRQASTSKRTRAEPFTPQETTSPAKRPRQSKIVKAAGADEVAPLGVRQHRHRHHLPEVHGSDTDDGISPPVTRSHCHFERFRIASQADPQAAPYLFNIPACALSSELARHTIKAFSAEDLGPVDETDGCEGIQLGGVNPNDADAIQVMASRHSNLVPHEDVLDAVRRIAGPELWDDGACEVVPQEEAKRTTRKGKRRAPEDASQESAKKRR